MFKRYSFETFKKSFFFLFASHLSYIFHQIDKPNQNLLYDSMKPFDFTSPLFFFLKIHKRGNPNSSLFFSVSDDIVQICNYNISASIFVCFICLLCVSQTFLKKMSIRIFFFERLCFFFSSSNDVLLGVYRYKYKYHWMKWNFWKKKQR